MAKGKFVSSMIEMAEKAGLDMSEAARMARAKEMGFDTSGKMLHGTDAEFESFDPSKYGSNFGDEASKYGAFFTNSQRQALRYGDNIGEYYVGGKLKKINVKDDIENEYKYLVGRGEFNGSFDEFADDFLEKDPYGYYEQGELSGVLSSAKKNGFDGLELDFSDMPNIYGKNQNVKVVFDPKNIRSVDAAFDPAKKDSSNLLAGAATIGGIGGGAALMAAPQNSYADTLHDVVMKAKPTTKEIMEAQRKREEYLRKIDALNRGDKSIQPPQSNAALIVASGMEAYNKERKKRLNPVLDFVLPAGELPVEYMTKIGYGDEITFKDRLNAVLEML